MSRVWSEGSMEQILVFENPEAILIPALKLNSQLSFQQNPILTELEFSKNSPITVGVWKRQNCMTRLQCD